IWNYFYKGNKPWKQGPYKDGVKDGKWITWYENGKKLQEGNFLGGHETGRWQSWYQNGQLKDDGFFKKERPDSLGRIRKSETDSLWKGWFASGKTNYEGSYVLGKKHGKWTFWFDKNGKIRETGNYWYGLKTGYWVTYHEGGINIDSEGKYNKSGKQTGTWKYYYDSGGPMTVQKYKEGKLTGKSTSWHTNGKIKSVASYKLMKQKRIGGREPVYNSAPHGTWIFYDLKGVETGRIVYKNGKKIS
ncbi:MAG: hypothetical protein IAF38_00125, partial [Bacteroidia bacterium]|nr:hypothetical protein [Bacteroidia bacterium]